MEGSIELSLREDISELKNNSDYCISEKYGTCKNRQGTVNNIVRKDKNYFSNIVETEKPKIIDDTELWIDILKKVNPNITERQIS